MVNELSKRRIGLFPYMVQMTITGEAKFVARTSLDDLLYSPRSRNVIFRRSLQCSDKWMIEIEPTAVFRMSADNAGHAVEIAGKLLSVSIDKGLTRIGPLQFVDS